MSGTRAKKVGMAMCAVAVAGLTFALWPLVGYEIDKYELIRTLARDSAENWEVGAPPNLYLESLPTFRDAEKHYDSWVDHAASSPAPFERIKSLPETTACYSEIGGSHFAWFRIANVVGRVSIRADNARNPPRSLSRDYTLARVEDVVMAIRSKRQGVEAKAMPWIAQYWQRKLQPEIERVGELFR